MGINFSMCILSIQPLPKQYYHCTRQALAFARLPTIVNCKGGKLYDGYIMITSFDVIIDKKIALSPLI